MVYLWVGGFAADEVRDPEHLVEVDGFSGVLFGDGADEERVGPPPLVGQRLRFIHTAAR